MLNDCVNLQILNVIVIFGLVLMSNTLVAVQGDNLGIPMI